MSWLRKLVHVFAVIGLAALSSIPFKRNAPQTSSTQGPASDSPVTNISDSASDNAATVEPRQGDGNQSTASASQPAATVPAASIPSSTVPAASDSSSEAGYASGPVSPGYSGAPPATSYRAPDSATSGFSASDRPLPEDDSTSVRPATVARLEIRAPRIVGDPPRDVRIRDDDPVPSMGSSFEPLWQPESSKRRITGSDGLPGEKSDAKKSDAKKSAAATHSNASERNTDAAFTDDRSGRDAATTTEDAKQSPLAKHRVVYGDSLESLAAQYLGDSTRADAIYEANRDLISDRYSLPVGVELSIPKSSVE